jgi:hypothetical protein
MLSRQQHGRPARIVAQAADYVKSLLASLLITWGVLCVVAPLAGHLTRFNPATANVPIPLSGFNDFVEGAEGNVYVSLADYSRVHSYSRAGQFIASYPAEGRGAELAAGGNGLIYLRAGDAVYTYEANWNRLADFTSADCASRTWRQGPDGRPLCVPAPAPPEQAPSRAVLPGELLYAGGQAQPRTRFTAADGTTLERQGGALLRQSAAGEVLAQFDTPWFLGWMMLPGLLWLNCVACFFLLLRLAKSAHQRGAIRRGRAEIL